MKRTTQELATSLAREMSAELPLAGEYVSVGWCDCAHHDEHEKKSCIDCHNGSIDDAAPDGRCYDGAVFIRRISEWSE